MGSPAHGVNGGVLVSCYPGPTIHTARTPRATPPHAAMPTPCTHIPTTPRTPPPSQAWRWQHSRAGSAACSVRSRLLGAWAYVKHASHSFSDTACPSRYTQPTITCIDPLAIPMPYTWHALCYAHVLILLCSADRIRSQRSKRFPGNPLTRGIPSVTFNGEGSKTMDKRITLYREGISWMATFHNDSAILKAFGTDTLPTSFLAVAPAAVVLERIQERNPDHTIEIKGE